MDKIKIINANFFNNNYLNSKLFTPLNKICVENQKNITSKYNSFFDSHRVYDYTNPLVIECKNDLKNSNFKVTIYLNVYGFSKVPLPPVYIASSVIIITGLI